MSCALFPAIDLLDGACVRLLRGDYDAATRYGADPVAQAVVFADAGAPWIHVVDLDAARTGEAINRDAIGAIVEAVDVPVQTGGGVRSVDAARALFDRGVRRVVMGTAAVERPSLVDEVAEHGAVAVGLDVKGREVATHGWRESAGRQVAALLDDFAERPVAAFVVTQIDVDGTLAGPDIGLLEEVLDSTDRPVVASGGVGSLTDVETVAAMAAARPRLEGLIVGKAIYEGAVDVAGAVRVLTGAC